MRLLSFAAALVLGFTIATPGEAQQRPSPLLDVNYAPPELGATNDRGAFPPVAPPPCSAGPGRDIALGALFGAVGGATVVFFVAVGRAANTLGRDRVNGTPYVVGGALLGAGAGIASWNRRCG